MLAAIVEYLLSKVFNGNLKFETGDFKLVICLAKMIFNGFDLCVRHPARPKTLKVFVTRADDSLTPNIALSYVKTSTYVKKLIFSENEMSNQNLSW